jgi:hypothetical protein
VLALNIEPGEDDSGPVNGALIELRERELDWLDCGRSATGESTSPT